ncbi:MAG TPA: holo-ACP synthase [Gemmatimonadaceae bacterium]|jgi:holo-[acyl-carrier protein] synthase
MIVGIGIDVVEIERIDKMFADKGDRMLHRLFTDAELSYISLKAFPGQHLAARLAAKEAAYKALNGNELARGIGWRDIEVFSRADGSPELRLHGKAAERFAELDGASIHVSLTHSRETAAAVVIVER